MANRSLVLFLSTFLLAFPLKCDAHPSFWEGLGRGVSEGLDWAFDGYNWYNHGARPFMHEKWHTAVGHFNRWRGDEDASRNNFDRASYERAQIWNARRRA